MLGLHRVQKAQNKTSIQLSVQEIRMPPLATSNIKTIDGLLEFRTKVLWMPAWAKSSTTFPYDAVREKGKDNRNESTPKVPISRKPVLGVTESVPRMIIHRRKDFRSTPARPEALVVPTSKHELQRRAIFEQRVSCTRIGCASYGPRWRIHASESRGC